MASRAKLNLETTDRLLKAMFVLSRTVNHVLATRAVDAAIDKPLSASKVQVLRLLAQDSGLTSSQIARCLGVSKPAVSQIVDSMVRARLVSRKPAIDDRREIDLRLTEKGKALSNAVQREQRHYIRAALNQAGNVSADIWIDTMYQVSMSLARADEDFEEICAQCGADGNGTCVMVGGDAQCLFLAHRNGHSKGAQRRTDDR